MRFWSGGEGLPSTSRKAAFYTCLGSPGSHCRLQERDSFLLTPFERNIEVWRQLWRVLERSHLVVQIVDARNPLRFRCEDLEAYVQDVEGTEGEAGTGRGVRRSLLLINKADLLTARQRYVISPSSPSKRHAHTIFRKLWADYFDAQGVQYAFFSAANAAALQEARKEAEAAAARAVEEAAAAAEAARAPGAGPNSDEEDCDDESVDEEDSSDEESDESDSRRGTFHPLGERSETEDPRTRVLSVLELEELFASCAPDLSGTYVRRLVLRYEANRHVCLNSIY